MQQILTYFFLVVYSITILGIILVIITENRNPLKTLPWIIVLVLAPVVGLVFYFFFGQNLSKQRIISRRTRKRITMQLEEPEHTEGPGIPPATGRSPRCCSIRCTPYRSTAAASPSIPTESRRWRR